MILGNFSRTHWRGPPGPTLQVTSFVPNPATSPGPRLPPPISRSLSLPPTSPAEGCGRVARSGKSRSPSRTAAATEVLPACGNSRRGLPRESGSQRDSAAAEPVRTDADPDLPCQRPTPPSAYPSPGLFRTHAQPCGLRRPPLSCGDAAMGPSCGGRCGGQRCREGQRRHCPTQRACVPTRREGGWEITPTHARFQKTGLHPTARETGKPR